MNTNKLTYRGTWLVLLLLMIPSLVVAQGENGVRRYISLGTSLSVGVQPDATGMNQRTDEGYADQLFDLIDPFGGRKLKLVKLGCPGETTVTMMNGGICEYDEGSQLAQALVLLRAHKDKVALISIDMGVNDILVANCVQGTNVDVLCILNALNTIQTNLTTIMTEIRAAAPNVPIVALNTYNPFLASWLTGPAGMGLAFSSDGFAQLYNGMEAAVYGAFGAVVADVYTAFNSGDFVTQVPFPPPFNMVPLNVATLCALTYNCTPPPVGPNIHANSDGYGVMAAAAAAALGL